MKRILFTVIALFAALGLFAQSRIKVDVHNIVGADERFNVTFIIEGESQPSSFDWEPGNDFQLVWGPQKGTSTSIRMENGKTTRSSQTTYTYILLPRRTGTFMLPAATARFKGEEISSEPVSVQVVDNGQAAASQNGSTDGQSENKTRTTGDISADDLYLSLTLSRSHAVVGEPVTATLKLYQRVNIAGFEGAKFPTFNGFWSQETEAPANVEFQREQVGDKIYNSAVLRRYILIPQKAGTLTIDPAELVCLVNVRNTAKRSGSIFDSFFEDDYVTVRKRVLSKALSLNVSALPSGAPSSFSGGVGNFTVSASVSKDSINAHDAASLLVTLSGTGNVSLLEAPAISFPPDFETYDVKSVQNTDKSGTSGSKTFEYPFIPRSHGDFVIPPVQYSYYNVNSGKYVTVSTDSLALHVAPGRNTGAVQSGDGAQSFSVNRKDVKNLGDDIRFIKTGAASFSSGNAFFVSRPAYYVIAGLIALAALAVWLSLRRIAARRADVVGTRNRKATKMALRRLATAETFLKKDLYTAFYEELHKALIGFISDKLNMDMAEQSRDNIAAALRERGAGESLTEEFTGLIEACEFARYSPDAGHDAMNAHYDTAVKVISSIDSGLKAGKNNAAKSAVSLVLLLLTLSAGAQSYPDSLWRSGTEAYKEGRWSEAAECWQGILDAGLQSSALYYNAGNAWFKAGDYPRAILNYERSLRMNPSDADARYNLEFVNSLIQDKIDPVPEFILKTWLRKVDYSLRSDTWAVLSLLALAGAFAMLLLFLLGSGKAARKTGFYTSIVLFLLALLSWNFAGMQYREYMSADGAIVMRAVSSVKSAPSAESSKDLFILHEGTKVRVLDHVEGWYNIELADGRQGWIESRDIEII